MILQQVALFPEEIAISFSEGQELYLAFPLLRRACPCAVCQGEPDALGRVVRPKVEYQENSFQLLRYQSVGGYALQFFWKDGHSTGIYSFDYLLRLSQL